MLKIFVTDNNILECMIREKIKDNNGYCPCKIQKIDENICPCKEFISSKNEGNCHCGLYYKKEV